MNDIRIERAQNGFVVRMDDPAIIVKNRKSDGPYVDPEQQFVFDDEAGVIAFLTKNLSKIAPDKDDYATSFDTAVKDSEDEEGEDEEGEEEEDEDK
jgi:hypothetical protein